jgi:hypothetical protein
MSPLQQSVEDNPATTATPTVAANLPPPPPPSPLLPLCQVNENGEFYISSNNDPPQSTTTTMVSFVYQVQGPLTLTVDLLQSMVLPALEIQLSNYLVPELFSPQACRIVATSVQTTASASVPGGIRRHHYHQRHLQSDTNNSNTSFGNVDIPSGQAPIIGLQATPKDTLLPSYEGGTCVQVYVCALYHIYTVN